MTAPALAARLAAFETTTLHKLGAARSYPRTSACGPPGDFESILERAEKRTRKEAQIMVQQVRNGRTTWSCSDCRTGSIMDRSMHESAPGAGAPSDARARLAALGLTLHGPHSPHPPLLAVVTHNGVAYVSGQLPRIDGKITCVGKLGESVSLEQGVEAAGVCALNALSVIEAAIGSLDRIEQFLKVTGFVASSPDFVQQPKVIDGASRIFHDVFGKAGRHTRSAIGVAALPHGAAVEIELSVAIAV